MGRVETIAGAMAAAVGHLGVQRDQTRFRLGLVDGWGIPAGASVLEVGCGQGDMTAVLADAVGPGGRVVAVDIAEPSYGSPVTLGESAAFLAAGPLGSRIDIRFGVDVLDEATTFPDDAFDYVVLSHCSWYFASLDQLLRTLTRVRPWARRLCFSEWDLRPRGVEQLPHLLAVLVQGHVEAVGARGEGNVRTPFSHEALLRILAEAGWRVASELDVDTTGLQDADWEVDAARRMAGSDERFAELSPLAREFLISQLDVLGSLAKSKGNEPLPSYALTADRA
ncbi:class I SAM-dependent methyltransferase [Streptomyces sp. RKAG293]|uniref:class I SAM-dependent methyltransferase n=1 Tax=Streptomyces sp. RKAG293 TaxID=2893403 RepID=UPI0035A825C3